MKRHAGVLALILLAAILFAPLCRGFVREVVVIPLLYLLWLVHVLGQSIPQAFFWPFFVILLGVILVASLIDRRRRDRKRQPPPEKTQGRTDSWAALLRQAHSDDYFKWRLGQRLQKVAVRALAHQRKESPRQTRRQLRRGELEMPPELLAYFQASLQSLSVIAPRRRLKFWQRRPPSPLDLDPARVAAYLEQFDTISTRKDDANSH